MLKTFLRLLSIKPILIMFLILVGGTLVGGYLAYDHYWIKEPPVELVKNRLWNRLEDKSHLSKFDGGIKLTDEKDNAAMLVAMNKQYDSATTWQMMYQFFGEHLWQAEEMLKSNDSQKQQDALRIMAEIGARAARNAYRDGASDAWLGARIAQAYFLPSRPLVQAMVAAQKATNAIPADPKAARIAGKAARANLAKTLTEETLIRTANRLFETAGEMEPVLRNYQLLVKIAPTNQVIPVRLEYVRVLEGDGRFEQAITEMQQLLKTAPTNQIVPLRLEYARVLERGGRFELAISELQQITNTNLTTKALDRLAVKLKQRADTK